MHTAIEIVLLAAVILVGIRLTFGSLTKKPVSHHPGQLCTFDSIYGVDEWEDYMAIFCVCGNAQIVERVNR